MAKSVLLPWIATGLFKIEDTSHYTHEITLMASDITRATDIAESLLQGAQTIIVQRLYLLPQRAKENGHWSKVTRP